jgi:hypothetical protein
MENVEEFLKDNGIVNVVSWVNSKSKELFDVDPTYYIARENKTRYKNQKHHGKQSMLLN